MKSGSPRQNAPDKNLPVRNSPIDGQDLIYAQKIQQLLLPKSSPVCSWCCIGVKNRMASGLGGDYFDFISLPDESQLLFIGDVTGHGLHASLVMSLIYGFMHRAALGVCTPLELVKQVNRFLINFARRSELIDQYFSSTLFYGVIAPGKQTLHYVNAGHVPALVLRDGEVAELKSTGPPIGFFETPEMQLQSFSFAKGDRLLLYTDGFPEATNAKGEMFGMARLKRLLQHSVDCDDQELLGRLFDALHEFGTCDPPADDCSAIVIDFTGFGS